ncbi:hypothetical protein M422DRAFT_276450 [Sphaerobolus stellatus SS14]|uniref:CCHC-type domain-containing protein n=1 Tax=Sphaerobolus stellatus (strain SS14) TaxID=990650 RepID=A0A0C9UC76_SPHS4|nr:hypothetical protein M422DRAFT_276450 [Sphaerobolus stellatus SS14]
MEYKQLLRLSKAGLLNPQDRPQSIQPSEDTRETAIQDNPCKSVQNTPFDGIEDNDTDSETTVRNHQEGSVPFQQPDDRDILDMSNNESDNALVQMVRYMLDQNVQTTMEKSPLAKAGVKVTPPDKYSKEQSFEALETFVSFLGTRLEGKALEWFDKTVEPRKYQGTPMDLEQVVTGLYGQYIPSLARHENHDSSHNSIECYNCGKSGHIRPNCPEPLRARRGGAIHIEDSPTEQVDDTNQDINDPIDDECPTEDDWGSKPSEFDWSDDNQSHRVNSVRYSHNMARVTIAVPIGPVNARKAKIAKEGEPLYDHTVKMRTTRPTQSKNDLLTIAGYFLVGGTKACCLFDSGCEGIIMSSEFARATGIRMHKRPEPIGIQQAFQGRTPFLRQIKANIDFNGLGSIIINGEMIDNDLSVWLTSNEAKIHGMSANKATLQGEQPLELIVNQLSKNTKESAFKTIKNELLVIPVPHTVKELQKLISMVAYMLPYCGHIKQPLDMLRHIYRDKPYVCNEEVYNVILDIDSALSTTNIVNYYDNIIIHDGYPNQHDDNVYSTKATVSASDYKKSLNNQNLSGDSSEEVQ